MPTLPDLLALTTIPNGGEINSADHRNNYAAIQTALNDLLDLLGAGVAGQVLESFGGTGVGWGGSASVPATVLPGAPSNGQSATLVDDLDTPTYVWNFVYSTAAALWLFTGGSPVDKQVATSESTTSATYVALATAGPAIVLPVAGTYLVSLGAVITGSSPAGGVMSYDVGAAAAVDADGVQGSANVAFNSWREARKVIASGPTTLTAKYRSTSGGTSATFLNRRIAAIPITLS